MVRGRSTKATPAQIKSLQKGMNEIVLEEPRYAQFYELLLSYGGDAVVPIYEEDLGKLLKRGRFSSGRSTLMKGRDSNCHSNSAALWDANKDKAIIVTGWALSADGIWRQHSWVKDLSGKLYETTQKRKAYFGFDLTLKEAENFFEENL